MSLASVLHSDIYSTSEQRSACPSLSSCCVTLAGEDPELNLAGKNHEWSPASDKCKLRSDIDSDLGEIDMEIEADYSVSSYLRLLTASSPLTLTTQ